MGMIVLDEGEERKEEEEKKKNLLDSGLIGSRREKGYKKRKDKQERCCGLSSEGRRGNIGEGYSSKGSTRPRDPPRGSIRLRESAKVERVERGQVRTVRRKTRLAKGLPLWERPG